MSFHDRARLAGSRRGNALLFGLLGAALALGSPRDGGASLWPDVPDRVKTNLASPNVETRRLAAAELANLPKSEAMPLLKGALTDPDVEVRLSAALAASKLGVAEATDWILPWLTDPDARLREGACDFFARLPQARVVKVLARSLGDTEGRVRLAAVRALGASASSEAVAPLLARLDDSNSKVRLAVARALARLGDTRAVTPLVSKVQDEASEVRQAVVRTLGELGDPKASAALVIALRDPATEVRIEALAALGRLRAADSVASIAPLSVDATKKPGVPDVRRAALSALGRIGTTPAVEAIVKTFGTFEDANAGVTSSPAREAAISAGATGAPTLLAVLEGAGTGTSTTTPAVAGSAAYALGEIRPAGASAVIVKAMRRGTVPLAVGLHALASIADPAELPVCLEHVAAPDRSVRSEALIATAVLLDPEHPDGRAVEPLLASLDLAQTAEDRAEIATLLGRTGADRVASVLMGLTAAKDERLRLAAIDALGTLGSAKSGGTLAALLSDSSGTIRLRAAIALGRSGGPDATAKVIALLDGLEPDRLAIVIALGGLLERHGDAASLAAARKTISTLGPERDLMVVAIGRSKGGPVVATLREITTSYDDADTRRAVAVAYGAHAGDATALAPLASLAIDPDPSVRAQAAWSLGAIGGAAELPLLEKLSHDSAATVAANAVAASGRIAAKATSTVPPAICGALADDRPYVRGNALGALLQLSVAGKPAVCGDGARERLLLAEDGNDVVRAMAARLAGHRLVTAAADDAKKLRTSLERCTLADPTGSVATVCREGLTGKTKTSASIAGKSLALVVFVAPDDGSAPIARSAFAIERPDGLLHVGSSDRRGAVVELHLQKGALRLRIASPGANSAPTL